MGNFIRLETERMCHRDHTLSDLDSHHELFTDIKAMYYLQDIKSDDYEASRKNLLKCIEAQCSDIRKEYFLRMEEKKNANHIGEIGYTVTDFTPFGKLVHMGYFIYPSYWNKGYTTEGLKRMLEFAFMEDEVYRVTTGCITENMGSEQVMIKCGMIQEGYLKEAEWHDGKMKDRVLYRMLKKEYETIYLEGGSV